MMRSDRPRDAAPVTPPTRRPGDPARAGASLPIRFDLIPSRPEMPRTLPRPAAVASGLLLGVAAAGCFGPPRADYSDVGLVDVSGTVTLDGEPLEGAVVRFFDVGAPGKYSFAQTDANGYYELQFNTEAAGVLPGGKEVLISTAATGPEVKGGGGPERVPARYNRDTELVEVVEEGVSSQTFDFALTSGGEIAERPAGPQEGGEDDLGGDEF